MSTPGFLPRAQVAIGIGYLALFVGFSVWARFDVPYRDDWDWMLSVFTGPAGLSGLLQPHNEHVIPLARLLMGAQVAIGGLSGHLIQYVALGLQLAVVWMFWREVERRWPDRPAWRRTVGGLVLVCLTFTHQLQSMVFAAAVLFPLVQFFTTLAVVAWLNAGDAQRAGSDRKHWWWGGTVICVAGAVASTTSGLVVPLLLGGLAWLRGASAKVVAAWAGATIMLLCAYVLAVGVGQPAAGSGSVEPWAPPSAAGVVAYGLAVLSAGAPHVHPGLAVLLGVCVLAGVVAAAWLAIRRPARLTRIEIFALGQMAFGIASTVMVTPGRAQFGVLQAAQSRYATFVVCLLAALVMFWASRLCAGTIRAWAPRVTQRVAATLLVVTLLWLVPNVYIGLLWSAKARNLSLAVLSLRSGVADPAWVSTLHPLMPLVDQVLAAGESRGIGIEDPTLASTVSDLPSATCSGAGHLTRRSRNFGMSLTGQWRGAPTRGVIIDRANVVVGLAQPLPWVTEPNPTSADLHAGVVRGLRSWIRRDDGDVAWGGFAQTGAGPPYRWVGGTSDGHWMCSSPLTVVPSIHAMLESVGVDPDGTIRIGGWAFACGEDIVTRRLVVDGVVIDDVHVESERPRPDVEASFGDRCGPGGPPGVQLVARWAAQGAGSHTAVLRVVTASGASAESAPLTFGWPDGGAR